VNVEEHRFEVAHHSQRNANADGSPNNRQHNPLP
jgi:hypothetical protein